MRTGTATSWIAPAFLLAAVLATSGASSVVTAALDDLAWLHALVLVASVGQAAWLCWLSIGMGIVPRDERPAAWRRRDAVRMAVAALLSGAVELSALLALRRPLAPELAIMLCVAAGFAACTGAFGAGRLSLALRDWRKRRARRARRARHAANSAELPAAAAAEAGEGA